MNLRQFLQEKWRSWRAPDQQAAPGQAGQGAEESTASELLPKHLSLTEDDIAAMFDSQVLRDLRLASDLTEFEDLRLVIDLDERIADAKRQRDAYWGKRNQAAEPQHVEGPMAASEMSVAEPSESMELAPDLQEDYADMVKKRKEALQNIQAPTEQLAQSEKEASTVLDLEETNRKLVDLKKILGREQSLLGKGMLRLLLLLSIPAIAFHAMSTTGTWGSVAVTGCYVFLLAFPIGTFFLRLVRVGQENPEKPGYSKSIRSYIAYLLMLLAAVGASYLLLSFGVNSWNLLHFGLSALFGLLLCMFWMFMPEWFGKTYRHYHKANEASHEIRVIEKERKKLHKTRTKMATQLKQELSYREDFEGRLDFEERMSEFLRSNSMGQYHKELLAVRQHLQTLYNTAVGLNWRPPQPPALPDFPNPPSGDDPAPGSTPTKY